MATIDHATAAAVRECFGPCSDVYETMDLDEIIDGVREAGSVSRFVSRELRMQGTRNECMADACWDDAERSALARESREMLRAAKSRLRAAGFWGRTD
jgi:hypothetical protein